MANIFQPGVGMDMSTLAKGDIEQYVQTTEEVQHHGPMDIFVSIVPSNIVQSMVDGNILAIIFFSVLFGLGVAAIGEKGKPVLSFFEGAADVMFWVTNLIMKFAPFGVFALIGVTVSKFGLESLLPLGKLMILVYATMAFFIVVVLGGIAKLVGINIFHLIKVLKDELLLAYSTSSSEQFYLK